MASRRTPTIAPGPLATLTALALAAAAPAQAQEVPAPADAAAATPEAGAATPDAAAAAPAAEAEAAAPAEAAGEEGESEGLGLTLTAGVSSIYNWRGRNLFAEEKLNDQNALFSIGASYAIGDFSISYWGGYQILGDNLGDNIDAGIGAEQDILFGWESEVAENVTLATTLALYFYPLAKEEAAGTAFPFYLEPSAVVTYSTAVDLKLGLFYYYGIQSAIESERYLYVNPGIEKSLELGETLGLDLAGAFGLKVPTGDAAKDAYDGNNSQDAVVSAALPWSFGEGMSLAPKLSFAWTNIKDADFADSYMTYGGLDFEWEL
ncbi:hypothetical protein L6V77_15790 [Myxococcota bacterium]|nr:hypothetical protein [Myxococcota bacterium]